METCEKATAYQEILQRTLKDLREKKSYPKLQTIEDLYQQLSHLPVSLEEDTTELQEIIK